MEPLDKTDIKKIKPSHIIHTIAYALLVGALIVVLYLYMTSTTPNAKKSTPLKGATCDTFTQLPVSEQSRFIPKDAYVALQEKVTQLQEDLDAMQTLENNAYDEQQNSEPSTMNESVTKPSKVSDFAKCYEMQNANIKISAQCRQDIISYVDKHQDAKYFEIIGIVDTLEFNLFNALETHKSLYPILRVNQKGIDKLKKFTRRGLAKDRASEASWVIKQHTHHKAATYNANYELVSKKGYRGVVIRAYK